MTGRRVDPTEIAPTLGAERAAELRNWVLSEVADRAEPPDATMPPLSVGFWVEDGLLDVYALDDEVEDATGVGGTLLLEVRVGAQFARCLVCGQANASDPRAWCSRRCRSLLRSDAYARFPGLSPTDAIEARVREATRMRNTVLGWFVPLTRHIAESLYHRY